MSDKSAEELARKAHASADNYALFPSATSKAMAHRDMDAALAAARREGANAEAAVIIVAMKESAWPIEGISWAQWIQARIDKREALADKPPGESK